MASCLGACTIYVPGCRVRWPWGLASHVCKKKSEDPSWQNAKLYYDFKRDRVPRQALMQCLHMHSKLAVTW